MHVLSLSGANGQVEDGLRGLACAWAGSFGFFVSFKQASQKMSCLGYAIRSVWFALPSTKKVLV
eukprot:scaffold6913_cov150-Skeletonema_marinoi.AAC.1